MPRNQTVLKADRIAVVGDAHGKLSRQDVRYFDGADYDLVLFVGDLGSGTRADGLSIIRELARMETPGLVLPGNNDAAHLPALSAELAHQRGSAALLRVLGGAPPGGVRPCGYSLHELETRTGSVTLLSARPCSMGGPELVFAEQLDRAYGIRTMEQSTVRLCDLVREVRTESLVILAHNGPTGLGETPDSPFGRDFALESNPDLPLDWGDPDLRAALDLCQELGKNVLGVIAGHMHRRQGGAERPFRAELGGIPCYNTAVVPRIVLTEEGARHHHIAIQLTTSCLVAEERWVDLPGS